MRTQAIFAAATAFFALAAAVPLKRDVAMNTVTEVDTVVEIVTKTVWVDPSGAPEAPKATSVEAKPTSAPAAASSPASQPSQPAAPPPANNSPAPSPSPSTTSAAAPAPPAATTTTANNAPPAQPAPEAPTTTQAPAPATTQAAPTTTAAPAAPTSAAPSAAPSAASSSGGNGQKYTGDITFYDVGLGSCGQTNSDSEAVVAMAAGMMNKATMCGKTITITYNGVSEQATVVDTCPGCSGASLDLSPSLFKKFASPDAGRVSGVSWSFN